MAWRGLQRARRVYERARRGPEAGYRVGKKETAVKRRGLAPGPLQLGSRTGRAAVQRVAAGAVVGAGVQGRSYSAYPVPAAVGGAGCPGTATG